MNKYLFFKIYFYFSLNLEEKKIIAFILPK